MDEINPFMERPTLANKTRCERTTYLVRSLVNGMFYYLSSAFNHKEIAASNNPISAEGFGSIYEAEVFARQLESERKDLCKGNPPYTRIEVKREHVEAYADTEDSSSADFI